MWCRRVLLVAAILSPLLGPAPASATTADRVTATVLWQQSAGGIDFVFREITIAGGGSTGWHWHSGQLYGVIKQGTLTHYGADCSVDGIYPAGAGVFELSGAHHVHIGRNLGGDPLVMQVLYVLPTGSALSEDAPDPGCGFS